ncbi:MAG: hypothetical protein KDB14_03025 [Planctomycetales bacterium]|nr:hypothetical protein [Planctomycetales bacterium]
MYSTNHLELAAILIERAPVVIEWPSLCSSTEPPGLLDVWAAFDRRHADWSAELQVHEAAVLSHPERAESWLEELCLTEPLSRVWTALIVARQRLEGLSALSTIQRELLARETDVRQRAVTIVLSGRMLCMETALRLHRLRRRVERLTEQLILALAQRYDVADLGLHPWHKDESAREGLGGRASLAGEKRGRAKQPCRTWWLVASRAALGVRLLSQTISPRRHCASASTELLEAIMRTLPAAALLGVDAPLSANLLGQYHPEDLACCPTVFPRRAALLPPTTSRFESPRRERF